MSKGKFEKAYQEKQAASETKAGIEELELAIKEIEEMGADTEQKFAFEKVSSKVAHTYRRDDGVIVMEYTDDAVRVHELHHGYEIMKGSLIALSDGQSNVTLGNEQRAYMRQFWYSPSSVTSLNSKNGKIESVTDISQSWVKGLRILESDGMNYRTPYSLLNYGK